MASILILSFLQLFINQKSQEHYYTYIPEYFFFTLINIISGAVMKTSGKVCIWGLDIDKYRKQSKLAVGVVPQELNIDAFFTPKETLNLHSGMFNVPKNN